MTDQLSDPEQKHTDIEFVIFGATGDLARRKLIPALYRCASEVEPFSVPRIIAVASDAPSTNTYRQLARCELQQHLGSNEWQESKVGLFLEEFISVTLDPTAHVDDWTRLSCLLKKRPNTTRVFYMALPPQLYGKVSERLSTCGLIHENCRIVLEKPIGYDLESARKINDQVGRYFTEEQIFRIDHYLGKETVQNLLALRFANILFEKV